MAMRREWAVNPAELTPEQIEAIEVHPISNYAVVGPPGSGKTNVLLLRAKYLMRATNGSVLCLVFTASLKDFIRKGMSEYGVEQDFVQTFHGWGKRQLDMNNIKLDFKDSKSFGEIAPQLRALLKEGKIPKLDYLLVDEAQDFSEDIIKLFFELAENVTLFFDKDQSIHQSDDKLKNVFPVGIRSSISKFSATLTLTKNFRVPFKIAELATSILPNSELDKKTDKTDGNEPVYQSFTSLEEELNFIKERIDDLPNENPDYNFVVLQKTTKERLPQIKKDFTKVGINVEIVGVYGHACDFNNNSPKLITYSSVKGLEFDIVFAAGATPTAFPGYSTDKNLAFVAVTRAKKRIYITGSSGISRVFCPPSNGGQINRVTVTDLF